ncbi:MAG TPA: DUF222 domain-containing protein [Micromonosporaceae bacterium]|nr:DUF222 domain-containing protein [Micromonosporaceae bacterium]
MSGFGADGSVPQEWLPQESLTQATDAVRELASRPAYALSDDTLRTAVVDLHRLASIATAATAMLTREASGRDLPRQDGATAAVAWLRDLLRVAGPQARQLVTLGQVMDARPALADAVTDGVVNAAQAAAIGQALADVAADDEPALIAKVETILIGHAAHFEPTILRRLGERVIAHVAPDLADERLRDRLDREARRARQRRAFSIFPDGLGAMRVSGVLDVEGAAIVTAALEPLSAPIRGIDGPDPRTATARRADALVEVCRVALACDGLPDNGGQPPQVNVTVDFDELRRSVAIGQLDSGLQLSPSTMRRLACSAQILPAVMDAASVPIDLGRSRRLFTGTARQAVVLRDRGCAFPGCDRPPRWTDIHHIIPWSEGGRTDRDNGVALCGFHHRLIHHSDWTVRLGADQHPEFIPPAHIDPGRRPRRNPYHPRK